MADIKTVTIDNEVDLVRHVVSMALVDAVQAGHITHEAQRWIVERGNELMLALLHGKVVEKQANKPVSIVEDDDNLDNLIIGGL